MKRTKNMYYKETIESRELYLYTDNGAGARRDVVERYYCICDCLRKHVNKHTFNVNKSIDLWYTLVTMADKYYGVDFGYRYNITDRFTAAVRIAIEWAMDNDPFHKNLDYDCILKGIADYEHSKRGVYYVIE